MRRLASEIISDLEMRVARLEKQAQPGTHNRKENRLAGALAYVIEEQLKENGLKLKDLYQNPQFLDIEELLDQNPEQEGEVLKWVGYGWIKKDMGAYTITKKGIDFIDNGIPMLMQMGRWY